MLNEFKNPSSFYRTAPFWSLNDKLEDHELKRQIQMFKNQGIGGAFLHPRGGLATEYLSDEFFNAIRICLEEMKRLNMHAWLYDEDRYPSGVAGNLVVKNNPEFAQLYISKDYKVLQAHKQGKYDNESYVDVCNKEAIEYFVKITHDEYYKRFKEYFGNVIPAIFTDEPHFLTHEGLPWTKDFHKKFKEKYKYDLQLRFNDLYEETETCTETRFHYWDLISDLFVKGFSKTIYDWCENKDIAYTGHFWDHVFPSPRLTGSTMPHYEFMQYPGIDMLFVACEREINQYGNDLIVKEVSSVANQLNKKRVLSETNGASGWDLDFAYQKRTADWQLALGINLFSQHLSLYSMTGYRKRDYPLSYADHQPWWEDYNILADYKARMCYALSQGKYIADVLVLHPSSSTWVTYPNDDKLKTIEDSIKQLVKTLNQHRVMFDLGDDIIMKNHAHIKDKKLCIGDMSYSILLIPEITILREHTFLLIKEFYNAGGTIACIGEAPYMLDGKESSEVIAFFKENIQKGFDYKKLSKINLVEINNKDISDIYAHLRLYKENEILFLCNLNIKEHYNLNLDGLYDTKFFNAETGEVSDVEIYKDCINFELAPLQSVLYIIDKSKTGKIAEPLQKTTKKEIILQEWDILIKDYNAINLQFCRASLDGGQYSDIKDVLKLDDEYKDFLKIDRGNIFVRQPYMYTQDILNNKHNVKAEYDFIIKEIPTGALMAAIESPDKWNVYVNDILIHPNGEFYKDRAFHLYDIKEYVKCGKNIIRLETNDYNVLLTLESIYIVGDFILEKGKINKPKDIKLGDITKQGYCYYSGRVSYSTQYKLDIDYNNISLEFGEFQGTVASVFVNGEKLRSIGWQPYKLDVTDILKTGENTITIEIANSLQNLLGPFGKEHDLRFVTPGSFYADSHDMFVPIGFNGFAKIIVDKI